MIFEPAEREYELSGRCDTILRHTNPNRCKSKKTDEKRRISAIH